MQGTTYSFPARANPLLTNEEDPNMRLLTEEASWFGEKHLLPCCPAAHSILIIVNFFLS